MFESRRTVFAILGTFASLSCLALKIYRNKVRREEDFNYEVIYDATKLDSEWEFKPLVDFDADNLSNASQPNQAYCGVKNFYQLINTTGVDPWPWVVTLGFKSDSGGLEWACSGALITLKHILTSARCVTYKGEIVKARIGNPNLTTDHNPDTDFYIQQAIMPITNRGKNSGNIGVLTLNASVPLSVKIRPICLPYDPAIRATDFTNAKVYIAGFKTLQNDNSSTIEREILETTIENNSACGVTFSKYKISKEDQSRTFCIGNENTTDTCDGFGGAPLMVEVKNRVYLLGQESYISNCLDPEYPRAFRKITETLGWINDSLTS